MWKYGTSKGVSGTPTAYINGTKLDSCPMTVADWISVLQSVYESKWTDSYLQS